MRKIVHAPFDLKQYNKWNERLEDHYGSGRTPSEYWSTQTLSGICLKTIKTRLLELGKHRLKALKDYITDIESDWAIGSVILRNLKYGSIATILAFLIGCLSPRHFHLVCADSGGT